MKLRPGRCMSNIDSQAWSRYSVKKPRKNYIKALPRTALLIFQMGVKKNDYDTHFILSAKHYVQIRSNALEAARQSANKYLEREIPGNYYMRVIPFPHNVVREKKFAVGAGADRVSQGMTLSFGKPVSVAARVQEGQVVFEVMTTAENKDVAREAMHRAYMKLPGTYSINMIELKKGAPIRATS